MSLRTVEILKFGGSSVGGPGEMKQSADVVYRHLGDGRGVVVFVSAMEGVTDSYRRALRLARRREDYSDIVDQAFIDQRRVIQGVVYRRTAENLVYGLKRETAEAERWLEIAKALGNQTTPYIEDRILPVGELPAAQLFAALLNSMNVPATFVDSRGVFWTDRNYGDATPDLVSSREEVVKKVLPQLEAGRVVVMPGFVAMDKGNNQTTFGPGGTDKSATVMAELVSPLINVGGVYLYKGDIGIKGIMTADPRIVRDAQSVPHAPYEVIRTLAGIGGNVIHPKATIHAQNAGVRLYCKSTLEPDHPGTVIDGVVGKREWPVTAVSALQRLPSIVVSGYEMDKPNVMAEILGALRELGIGEVRFVTRPLSGRSMSVAFMVSGGEDLDEIDESIRQRLLGNRSIDEVTFSANTAAVGVVGLKIGSPAIMRRLYLGLEREKGLHGAVEEAHISKGDYDYSMLLDNSDGETAKKAVRAIHSSLFS